MLRGLAQYRVLRSLGRGAQGEVLLAIDTRLNRRVCIKLYHLEGRLAARRRAVAEAWQLTRVEGPRIAEIYDVVAQGARLALVTRYVPGCDLAGLLDEGTPLPPANALAIASDLAAALANLRRARTAHGDLKAGNVCIDLHSRAVLVDFGTAVFAGEVSAGYSPESLSPEQLRGEPLQLQSDFFALGLLLYRMLFGRHPFYRDGGLDRRLLREGLREVPELPGLEPAAMLSLRTLLLELLAAKVGARPASTFVLRERLRELRGLLPAPGSLAPRVRALGERSLIPGPPPRLPARLVRLPLAQRSAAWLRAYWKGGTHGARVLLAGTVGAVLLLMLLVVIQPGPCVAVSAPVISAGPLARESLPDTGTLHARITQIMKRGAARARVLGTGAASDSRLRLSALGIFDICVARRRLSLDISCTDGRCLYEMRGQRPDATQLEQLWLPAQADYRRLDDALVQMVQKQQRFLLR